MTQHIISAEPPLIDQIDRAFKSREQSAIYSWGDIIYAPNEVTVSAALRAHEAVHGERQVAYVDPVDSERGITAWWLRYIADSQFRLDEEVPAHRAEYRWHAAQPGAGAQMPGWRTTREFHLHHIASRLAGPLYGKLISVREAKRLIAS